MAFLRYYCLIYNQNIVQEIIFNYMYQCDENTEKNINTLYSYRHLEQIDYS